MASDYFGGAASKPGDNQTVVASEHYGGTLSEPGDYQAVDAAFCFRLNDTGIRFRREQVTALASVYHLAEGDGRILSRVRFRVLDPAHFAYDWESDNAASEQAAEESARKLLDLARGPHLPLALSPRPTASGAPRLRDRLDWPDKRAKALEYLGLQTKTREHAKLSKEMAAQQIGHSRHTLDTWVSEMEEVEKEKDCNR